MKLVLLVLILAVVLGTAVGYTTGSRLSFENRGINTIVSSTEINKIGDQKFVLNYKCNGKLLVSFDVDTDTIVSAAISEDDLIKIWKPDEDSLFQSQSAVHWVTGLVTGGGAARFGKPLLTVLKSRENSKYTVSGLIGGLSGFYLGYELGIGRIPACDSLSPLLLMRRKEVWKVLKLVIARHYLLQDMVITFPQTNFALLKEIGDDIEQRKVTSETFGKLERLSASYTPPDQPQRESWYSLDRILSVYVPVVVLILAALFAAILLGRHADKLTARRKKADAS